MLLRIFIICLLLILGKSAIGQVPLDTLDISVKRKAHLTHYYKYLEDCKGYDSKTVFNNLYAGTFQKPTPNRPFNMGISNCSYWLAIVIKNGSSHHQSILWTFYNNGLLFHLYQVKENGSPIIIDNNSMHRPLQDRNYPVRGVSFQIKFNPHETKCLLVKVEGTTANNIYFPIDISTTEDLLLSEINFSYLIGKYIGYFLLAFIINILLWIALKNKLHFFHACYILMIIGFTLDDFHFDSLEFQGSVFQRWSYINETFFISMALYFCIRAFKLFTDQKNKSPRLNRCLTWYNNLLLAASIILLIISLFIPYKSPVYKVWGDITFYYSIAGFLFIIYAVLYGVFMRYYYSVLYLISSAFLLAGFISYMSGAFKLGRLYLIRPGNIINGLAIEIVILTAFFVYKYKQEKEDLEKKTLESVKLKEELSQSLITVQENERKRLAQDLHDDVGNTINGLRLLVQNYFDSTPPENNSEADYRKQLLSGMKKVNNGLRDISRNLMPKDIEAGGLLAGIKNQVELLGKNNANIEFKFIHIGEFEALKPNLQINVYRIINELLQNIIKHSGASKATIQCLLFNSTLQVIAEDDGKGFNPSSRGNGIGLESIRSRVNYLNGVYKIDSSPMGTTFLIEIPIV